ncbi:serA, partial [Symbiodinium necroappetens]
PLTAVVDPSIVSSLALRLPASEWRLIPLDTATEEELESAEVLCPPFSLARNASAFSSLLQKVSSGKLLQWMAAGTDLINMSAVPSHFAICDVHQGGVAIPEYVLAGILQWNVRMMDLDSAFRRCTWMLGQAVDTVSPSTSSEVYNQTVGIVGFGTIGRGVGQRAAAFGMRVIAVDEYIPSPVPSYVSWIGHDDQLPKLMAEADFVVVAELSYMKQDGVLINVARGPIVDENALWRTLQGEQIGGAILDVWWHDFSWYQNGSPAPSLLLAPHAAFRAHFPGGRPRSSPGFGCKGAVAVWLGSCMPLWRRSRRQCMGHREQTMTLLAHSNKQVKNLTLHLLHERMPGESLLQRRNTTLCKLLALVVNLRPLPLLSLQRQSQNLALKLLCELPATGLAEHRQLIASCHDKHSNTWLHVAAAEGHLQACEILVDSVGLPLHARNDDGLQPLALAKSYEVDQFVRSRMHFRETRFGHGNAFAEMMQDERLVSEVVWYTIPLPGLAGKLGGLHSFLEVTVGGGVKTKRYVLEKAGSVPLEAHQEHGVFIGSDDLGTNLLRANGVDMHSRKLSLTSGSLKPGLKMKDLHEQAHKTGRYDLASSNCHHAAQLVFNHCCAREADREATTPNELMAVVAAGLSALQLHLFNSRSFGSETSGSEFASVESEVPSSALRAAPRGFTKAFDVSSDPLAFVAAALSHAVYDEDPASILKPREAAAGAVIHNELEKPVDVQDSPLGTSKRIEAGDKCTVDHIIGGPEKALVNIIQDGFVKTPLAENQPIWMGRDYELTRDFRGEVIVQEVAMPRVEVLHTVHAGNGVSPVEWLLARSGDAIYLCFRGTDDVQDAAIDFSVLPDFHRFKEYGIGVHGGIAHALEQEGDRLCHVVSDVLQALQEHRRAGERLVLCGHSLGGAYAQVMAVHLLTRKVEVTALRTFGTPHVFIPGSRETSPLWRQLCSISQHWVRDWDPVPRLPLCKTWLTEVLPKLKLELGGIRVGVAETLLRDIQQNYKGAKVPLLEGFDVAGEVVLVSKAPISAHIAREGGAPQKELLSEKPPEASMTFNKLNAYHDMEEYLQIARLLTGPEAA